MNKSVYWFASLFLLLGIFARATLAADLNVVHSGKWPPYSSVGLPGQGLAMDLAATALKRAGYSVYLTTDSWNRVLEGGKIGVYDVVATAWYSDERNEYLYFSKPYVETYVRFIKRKNLDFEYTKFDDLKGMMIGVLPEYAYDDQFNQSRDLIKITESNIVQNLLKLKQGRLDLTLDDELVLRYQINQYMPNSMAELEFLAKPLAVTGIHIAVSRENPDHAKIVAGFDKAIADMKKDGSYEKIMEKHRSYIDKPAQ